MKKIISAVYPGSFDPPTNGHLDIIIRASRLFPKIIIAVTDNINKKYMFRKHERISLVQKITKGLKNVNIVSFSDSLLVDYVEQINSFVLIRGLRVLSDFEYEFQMALMNRKLNKKIETVFLMTDQNYTFLSSSIVKEIAILGGDIKGFVHKYVEEKMKKRIINLSKIEKKNKRI
ncbi:MAG: pantetheine-phosphate adenylyltransferase [Endomicrobium sp.]|jgi:pantetheine-phosphate adenylyltransferase|nr:pantetheine-phosphate adenylyltransferase [Endomicrobium sp.]